MKGNISRRGLVKGTAWAVPVVLASTAVPALAASHCQPGIVVPIPTNTSTDGSSLTHTFTATDKTQSLTFTITGGAGGSYQGDSYQGFGGRELLTSPRVTPSPSLPLAVAAPTPDQLKPPDAAGLMGAPMKPPTSGLTATLTHSKKVPAVSPSSMVPLAEAHPPYYSTEHLSPLRAAEAAAVPAKFPEPPGVKFTANAPADLKDCALITAI